MSIACYYTDERETGRAACECVLSQPDLPGHVRASTELNLTWYVRPLAELAPSVRYTSVPRLDVYGWSWFNPSIVTDGADVTLLVRSSNYTIEPSGRYVTFDQDGSVRSRHYRLLLDDQLRLRELSVVTGPSLAAPMSNFPVKGFEDCRLIRQGDQWLAIAVARDHNPDGINQQMLLRLDGSAWVDCLPLSAPEDGHQKNWMPFVADGELYVVRQCWPLTVARVDTRTGLQTVVAQHDSTPLAASFRGGSQGIPIDDGWLFVVHETIYYDAGTRLYTHRLIRLDRDFQLTHVSPQMYFSRKGIEYCAGMARLGEDLLLSFGSRDQEAWIARLPLVEALALLAPVGAFAAMPQRASGSSGISDTEIDRAGIVSVTLAGPGTERLIADALRSVIGQVDRCLVIDTGIGDEGIAAARAVAGDRLIVRTLDWPGDFSAARNAALAMAAQTGAAWAVAVDTDERLDLAVDLGAVLAETTQAMLAMPHQDAGYSKPRVFRLPARGVWVGQTHEYFDLPSGSHEEVPGCSFTEMPRSQAQLRVKLGRDARALADMTARQPHDARWWYYLGDTLVNLGDIPGAISAFDRCASLDGWNEEAAWARYREAECWLTLGVTGAAIRACAAGLTSHPGVAELAWLAGFASWQAGEHEDAVRWSELAVVHGATSGRESSSGRIGFRNPMALHEGPYDVLRHALRALGRTDDAQEAERQFGVARDLRLSRSGG